MTMIINPSFVRTVSECATESSRTFDEGSQISSCSIVVHEISWDSLKVGRLLGKGGFANVNEVTMRDGNNYAIKYLRADVMKKKSSLKIGVKDLVTELKFLANLQNEHVIKLHGVSQGLLTSRYSQHLFIVIDLLTCTLDDKIRKWRFKEDEKMLSNIMPMLGLWESEKIRLYERVSSVGVPLAKALIFLHDHNVIFRDLKPGNIGFDANHTLKLFDFGLARELKTGDRDLTQQTGSPLFMSPEVAFSTNYGLPADIYSFAYILWELTTLRIPFDGFTRDMHTQKVLKEGHRPRVDNRCGSVQLQQLITKCWDTLPGNRPSPEEILKILQRETTRKLGKSYKKPEPSLKRSSFM